MSNYATVTPDCMFFTHEKWLLCPPNFYDVTYEINPWMKVADAPHKQRASLQWQALRDTFVRLGVEVEYVEAQPGWPDMVFTANGGLVHGKKAVLSSFKFPERQGEEPFFKAWFESRGYQVHVLSSGNFEGEGDALIAGGKLFGGFGFRSDKEVYPEIAKFLEINEVVLCEMVDPYFYHLDTCFCPFSNTKAIYYPGAFTPESVKRMGDAIELIPIPEADARRFACNAVVLGHEMIIPAGCTATTNIIEGLGYIVTEVELDEYIKAGGAAKCLSLRV